MAKLMLSEEERAIVDILNPEKTEKKLPEKLPVDFIINNNICYRLYNKVGSELDSKYNSEELEPMYRKAKYMEFSIAELRNVSKAFEEKGINFVFLFKAIESQCDTTDVDTIVEGTQIEEAGKVLERLGYFVPLFPYEKYNFVKSNSKNEVVLISLQTEEEFKKYHYIVNEERIRILNDRRKVNDLYVPSFEKDLVICVNRTIDKKQIPLGTILHIAYLLENCSDVDYIKKYIKKGWYIPLLHSIYMITILYTSLFNREIESPLIPVAERVHGESKILKFLVEKEAKIITLPFNSKTFILYWHTYELLINIRTFEFRKITKSIFKPFQIIVERINLVATARKRRILICFSGIDGTGKTTHTTKLVRRFKDMAIPSHHASFLWSPKISYPLMGAVYVLKGWRKKDYKKSKIMKKIWNYIVILDFIYIYMTKMWFPRLIGKTVFCDKYTYDLIVQLMHDGLYNEKASKILLNLMSQPDLAFVLDIPEVVSTQRKDDTQEGIDSRREEIALMDYLKKRREGFIKVAQSLNIPVIDATKEWNELHEEIFNKVINTYKNKGVDKK